MSDSHDDIVHRAFVLECSYCGERRLGTWEAAKVTEDLAGPHRTSHGCCPACEPRLLSIWLPPGASDEGSEGEARAAVDERTR